MTPEKQVVVRNIQKKRSLDEYSVTYFMPLVIYYTP